jgi:uncharacterized protein YqjF (DUF2071 family)
MSFSGGCADPSFRPVFAADWLDLVCLHLAVDPRLLQPIVPLELDLFEETAFVSIVAFRQSRFRLAGRGAWSAALGAAAAHPFLNVRAYVRSGGERAIFFIAEWVSNVLGLLIAPMLYGLPYRLGRIGYHAAASRFFGQVSSRRLRLRFAADLPRPDALRPAPAGSLAEFILERYAAFTARRGVLRRFRVAHAPWLQAPVEADVGDRTLLDALGPWAAGARLAAAHASPGARGVLIGSPERAPGAGARP